LAAALLLLLALFLTAVFLYVVSHPVGI